MQTGTEAAILAYITGFASLSCFSAVISFGFLMAIARISKQKKLYLCAIPMLGCLIGGVMLGLEAIKLYI